MGGGKSSSGRISAKGMRAGEFRAYTKDLGSQLASFITAEEAVHNYNTTYAFQHSIVIGRIERPETRAELRRTSVSERSSFGSSFLGVIYADVAKGLLLHALAIAFPPVAILMAGIAVATVIVVSLEVSKAVDHYEHGTLKASEAGKVVKDVTNLAVGTAAGAAVNTLAPVPSSMTVSYSGSQIITEVAKEVVTDAITDTASEEARRITERNVRAHRRRGLVKRQRRIQSKLDASFSQIEVVGASQA